MLNPEKKSSPIVIVLQLLEVVDVVHKDLGEDFLHHIDARKFSFFYLHAGPFTLDRPLGSKLCAILFFEITT